MKAPRVLVSGVVLGQPMGGVRRHNAELLPRVARLLRAHNGHLAVMTGAQAIPFELPKTIEILPSAVPAGPPIARAGSEGQALRAALAAARERGRPFDLVHTAHFPVPRSLPVPFTLTVHDLRALSMQHSPMSRRLLADHVIGGAVRRAAQVFAVSETVARELEQRLRAPAVRVIGNGCDHFAPLPRSPRANAPLVHLGHIEPRKNLDLVVRALALDPGLPDLELWGAAKPGEDERVRKIAHELGVADRVRLRGPYDESALPRILSECSALVMPSTLEGFGIPVMEAQRALAPVAIASAGALPEVAGRGVPAFAPDDPEACAAAIHAALARPLAELEHDRARAGTFTWDRAAEAWFEGWCEAHARA